MIIVLLLSACGPGVADFQERIDGTNLVYVSTGKVHRYIARLEKGGSTEIVIPARVVTYIKFESVIVVARQPTIDWDCNGQAFTTTVEKRLEYFVISNRGANLVGPFDYEQLKPFVKNADVHRFLSPEVLSDKLIERELLSCDNPRKVG